MLWIKFLRENDEVCGEKISGMKIGYETPTFVGSGEHPTLPALTSYHSHQDIPNRLGTTHPAKTNSTLPIYTLDPIMIMLRVS